MGYNQRNLTMSNIIGEESKVTDTQAQETTNDRNKFIRYVVAPVVLAAGIALAGCSGLNTETQPVIAPQAPSVTATLSAAALSELATDTPEPTVTPLPTATPEPTPTFTPEQLEFTNLRSKVHILTTQLKDGVRQPMTIPDVEYFGGSEFAIDQSRDLAANFMMHEFVSEGYDVGSITLQRNYVAPNDQLLFTYSLKDKKNGTVFEMTKLVDINWSNDGGTKVWYIASSQEKSTEVTINKYSSTPGYYTPITFNIVFNPDVRINSIEVVNIEGEDKVVIKGIDSKGVPVEYKPFAPKPGGRMYTFR
jgi:hypothetical protein